MPIVPFTSAGRTESGKPLPPPPPEPFALMAAATMHAEGRLIEPNDKGGAYIGELGKDDDLSYDRTLPIGRRNGDKIERTADPKELMKNLPAGDEGYTLPDNPHLFIRKKTDEALTS